jgi:capsular exopolysaccharide synthesis family protein
MSRVYEALRQSELETGIGPSLLDPDTFLAPAPTTAPAPITASAVIGPISGFPWDKIKTLAPDVTEESRVVALNETNHLGAEKFRLLRVRLRNLRERRPLQKRVITSAVPNDGKTLVAMNLAVSLAKHTNERVLLLEGDLRKPMAAHHMGVKGLPGLGEWLLQDKHISEFIYHFEELQLWILPAGSAPDNPGTILQSPRFLDTYRELVAAFDWIIIDAPPLIPMADVSYWSRQADGLLLVVREGKTSKAILKKGLETLDNPKLVGIVLNDVREVDSRYYHNYYYGKKESR